jgi:hypothetical protein
MHYLSNKGKEKWIEDDVGRETARARKRVEHAEALVQQEQDDMTHADFAGLNGREPERTFEEMLVAIGETLSDLARSNDGEVGEGEDDKETVEGQLSEDDEPG